MAQAKQGDTVRVHYTGKFEDGEVFDSSRQRDPLQVTLGAGQVITGFDKALEGMAPGEAKSVNIQAQEAYGQREDQKILDLQRDTLPPDTELQVGQRIQLQTQDGHLIAATVAGVSASTITIDANHPLAGKNLIFDLELVEIV